MKLALMSILLTSLVLISASSFAQSTTDAAERADTLRLKLLDVQAEESELQERVQQLDEDLKPENIERSLAGFGSTRPEELRETRRRQLQIQKDSMVRQLDILAKTRTSLEAAIVTADADAYHQSANGTSSATLNQFVLTQVTQLPRWMMVLILALLTTLGIAAVVIIRRLQRSH